MLSFVVTTRGNLDASQATLEVLLLATVCLKESL